MNNNQFRKQEFEKRRVFKKATSLCNAYSCPIFQNCLLEIKQFQQENNQLKKMVNHKHKYCSEMEGKYILEKYKLDQLRSWLEKQVFNRGGSSIDIAIEIHTFCKVLDKLNELEGGKNDN